MQAHPLSHVNLRNGRQQTPLLLAVDKRHVTIAKLLLENGAQVNAQDDVGDSPLHVVVMYHSLKFGGSNTPMKEVGSNLSQSIRQTDRWAGRQTVDQADTQIDSQSVCQSDSQAII